MKDTHGKLAFCREKHKMQSLLRQKSEKRCFIKWFLRNIKEIFDIFLTKSNIRLVFICNKIKKNRIIAKKSIVFY